MKPSEFLLNKEKEIYIDMSISTTKDIINKLDKRFIDREELLKEIKNYKKEIKYHKGDDISEGIIKLIKIHGGNKV